jgi:hypothetical protein
MTLKTGFEAQKAPFEEEAALLQYLYDFCSKYPGSLPAIIDTATNGVKRYAESQRNYAAHFSAILMSVLRCTPRITKSSCFSAEKVLESLEPWFRGTDAYNSLKKKFLGDKK